MRIIDYICYRLYRGSLKSELKRPRYLLASITLSVCLHANIICLSYSLFFFCGIPFIYGGLPDWIIKVVSVVLALFFYILYRNGRGSKVYAKYHKETQSQKKKRTICIVCYFVFTSITAVFGGGILRWIKYGYFPL